ncbi:MAG: hypothetical protein V1738_02405 [Patescibacteria group bacterium]
MKRLNYILIPAVLAFSLFFGISSSGAHDLVFTGGHDMHMACEGMLCGFLPEITCSVHCLTAGVLQSLDSPVAIIILLSFVAVLLALMWSFVILPNRHYRLGFCLDRPPPNESHLTVQKKE